MHHEKTPVLVIYIESAELVWVGHTYYIDVVWYRYLSDILYVWKSYPDQISLNKLGISLESFLIMYSMTLERFPM